MTKKSNCTWEKTLRGLSKSSIKNYSQAVRLYEKIHGDSMDNLIEEALDEQTARVAEHQLKIYDRIVDFRDALLDQGRVVSGVGTYVTRIKTIYKKSRVRIPYIPPLSEINGNHNPTILFEDLLTKDEIRQGIEYLPLIQQARLLAMVSGGLSNEECANLKTKEHFIDPLYKYHQCDDDAEALRWLAKQDNILWCVKLTRGKTGKQFYAIMSPETVQLTAKAKLEEIRPHKYSDKERVLKDNLYPTDKDYFGLCCRRINEGLHMGEAGNKSRFRPHMFRKFHSTAIRGQYCIDDDGLSVDEIDELQGRGMTSVQETYIKTNPIEQKLIYMKVINNVSLWHKYSYEVIDSHDPRKVDLMLHVIDDEEKTRKLEKENKDLRKKLEISKDVHADIKDLISDKGIDEVADIIATLLSGS